MCGSLTVDCCCCVGPLNVAVVADDVFSAVDDDDTKSVVDAVAVTLVDG